jgi:PEP-CTERM motif
MSKLKQPVRCVSSEFARFILPAVAIMLAAPIASRADIITLASVELDAMASSAPSGVYYWLQVYNAPFSYGTAVASASATYTGTNSSSVSASGTTTPGSVCLILFCSAPNPWISTDPFIAGADASAGLIYYVEVVPIPLDVPLPSSWNGYVPLDMSFTFNVFMGASTGTASASVNIFDETDPDFFIQQSACAGSACASGENPVLGTPINISGEFNPGDVIAVQISVEGGLTSWGTWSASIDPEIYIDPSFQYADDFTLIASPALTSSSAPEPASLALLGTGLLLIGLLRLRVQR